MNGTAPVISRGQCLCVTVGHTRTNGIASFLCAPCSRLPVLQPFRQVRCPAIPSLVHYVALPRQAGKPCQIQPSLFCSSRAGPAPELRRPPRTAELLAEPDQREERGRAGGPGAAGGRGGRQGQEGKQAMIAPVPAQREKRWGGLRCSQVPVARRSYPRLRSLRPRRAASGDCVGLGAIGEGGCQLSGRCSCTPVARRS